MGLLDRVAEGGSGDGGLAAAGVDAFDAEVGLSEDGREILKLAGVEESIACEDADAGVGFPRSRFAIESLLKLLDEFAPGVADGGAFFFEVGWEEHPDYAVVGFDADLGVGVWRFGWGWGFGSRRFGGFDGFTFENGFGEVAEVVVEVIGFRFRLGFRLRFRFGVGGGARCFDRANFGSRGRGFGWDGGRSHGDTVQL